jgi:hypothetical protein
MLNIYFPICAEIRCKGLEENALGISELCENSECKQNYPCLRTLKTQGTGNQQLKYPIVYITTTGFLLILFRFT